MNKTVFIALGYDNDGGPDRPLVRVFSTAEAAKAYAYDLLGGVANAYAYEAVIDDPIANTEDDGGADQL
jgi:hypothetical protein